MVTVRLRHAAAHLAVVASSFIMGGCILAIVAMTLAAVAFANTTTTAVPFVVTFQGGREADGSLAVLIDGSPTGALVTVSLFALAWWPVAVFLVRPASRRGSCSSAA